MKLRHSFICAAALASLALAGCSGSNLVPNASSNNGSDSKGGGQPIPSFTQFTDIFGASDAWHGRLVINAGGTPAQMYDFYEREMPNFGWSKVTVVRADISVMVYDRESRVATIKLQGGSFAGSTVDITVSPKG